MLSCQHGIFFKMYTRSYGTVSSIGLMGQNCKPYMVLWYLLSIHSSSNPNADILVTSLVLKHCAHALRQPRGCYFNWLWPFVMLRATPQLYAQPRPCSGSIRLMGRPQSIPPKHKRTHIGVCSLDTNRRSCVKNNAN
jgi:hypothetical protein